MNKIDIIEKNKKDYNLISDHFSNTRKRIWKDFDFLGDDLFEGAKVLDLGCGNGRFYPFFANKKVDYYGIDKSDNLISKAKEIHPTGKFFVADALSIPFADEYFDFVFSIAVLHHMPTFNFRISFINEAERVLKTNGRLKITVWNLLEHKKSLYFNSLSKKIKGEIGIRDTFIPWKNNQKKIITNRYYHFFTEKELKFLFGKNKNIKVEKIFKKGEKESSNIFVLAKKC